jgi:exonuclease SbcC
MNPLHLSLRNCRTFQQIDLDLSEGLLAIIGANGAGKSTLINAIDVALFGPESRSLADWYPRGAISDGPMVITLTFDHGGETYRVRRSFSPKGRGQSKTDLEQQFEGPTESRWIPMTLEAQSATNEQISDLIGITRETFRASSFLAQGDAGRFCEAAPRERKRVMAEVVGLGQWDVWLERARTEKRTAESELDRIAGSLERADAELAERSLIEEERAQAVQQREVREAQLQETVAALATAREALAEAERQVERRAGAQKAVQDAERQLSELQAALSAREAEIETIDHKVAAAKGLAALAESLPALTARKDALVVEIQQWRERQRVEREIAAKVAERARLEDEEVALTRRAEAVLDGMGAEKCDRCGQTLHEDAALRAAESYRQDAAGAARLVARLDEQISGLADELGELPKDEPDESRLALLDRSIASAQSAKERLAAIGEAETRRGQAVREADEMRAGFQQREQSVADARAALLELGPHDPSRVADSQHSVVEAEREIADLRASVASYDRTIAQADTQLARLDKIAADVSIAGVRRDQLHTEIDLLSSMEKACGPNGVPALILETVAIPQVEAEATRILGLLGGPAYACELRTLREKKTGGLSDTLDVVLLTETGEAPYETFSGGERARVSFALRLALAQLLASRKGSATGLLVIDELEGLDAEGIAALVGVLEDLQRSVPRIIVVSHNPEMRDAFENTIMLEQVDGRSRIVSEVHA